MHIAASSPKSLDEKTLDSDIIEAEKNIIKEHVESVLDHKNLNLDVPYFKDIIPSAENISIFIYDIQASIAHVNNLFSIGIIKKGESTKIIKSLKDLKKKFQEGSFKLTNKYEDCHSAIEFYLTKELGELGKKVHTGRSRNDQVIVAMRLFAKQNLINFKIENKLVAKTLLKLAKKHENHQMPGYTHLQRAMPSSWGLWFSSYAESFIDNIDLINSTIDWIDSNPLGSAAGYGVSLPLNRKQVTKELGFKRIQLNSLYVQNSRGKYEMQILHTLKPVSYTHLTLPTKA